MDLMKFDVILADPPWRFTTWSAKGTGRSAEQHYPTMATDDIKKLQVPSSENCAAFVWASWPLLSDALSVLNAWGFRYATAAFVWVKARRSGFGFFTGMGYYTRANTEVCLLGIKGTMPVAAHDVAQLIYSPVRAHSKKPDEQYEKIERLYPDRRYVELFARQTWPGWESWGNEVPSTISMMTHDQA
jgi:N6-adenosine-specific RNA methylase IME4